MKTATRYDETKCARRDNYCAKAFIQASVAAGFSCAIDEHGFPLAMAIASCIQTGTERFVRVGVGAPERAVLIATCKAMADGGLRFEAPQENGAWVEVCRHAGLWSGCEVAVLARVDGWLRIDAGARVNPLSGHEEAFSMYVMEAQLARDVGCMLLGGHIEFEFEEVRFRIGESN